MKQPFGSMLLALVVLAVSACGGGYGEPKPAATTPPSGGTASEVAVTLRYPAFQPSSLTATKGQPLKLRLTNSDSRNHTFTIDELGVNIAVGGGQTLVREIVAQRAGSFTFYCAVPGHREAGMKGTLRVGE